MRRPHVPRGALQRALFLKAERAAAVSSGRAWIEWDPFSLSVELGGDGGLNSRKGLLAALWSLEERGLVEVDATRESTGRHRRIVQRFRLALSAPESGPQSQRSRALAKVVRAVHRASAKALANGPVENRPWDLLRALIVNDDRLAFKSSNRIRCLSPLHADYVGTMTVYADRYGGHAECHACGYVIDAETYLVERQHKTAEEAAHFLRNLGQRRPPTSRAKDPMPAKRVGLVRQCPRAELPQTFLEMHLEAVSLTHAVPAALAERAPGFTLDDARRLQIAAKWDRAVLPIFGPQGQLLAVKHVLPSAERHALADRFGFERAEVYEPKVPSTPAWCSPNFGRSRAVLVVPGELEGMACWLAQPELDVVGAAGLLGSLPLRALRGRRVYVFTGGAGEEADATEPRRDVWARALRELGCPVDVLPPWGLVLPPLGFAPTEVVGKGRQHLRSVLP